MLLIFCNSNLTAASAGNLLMLGCNCTHGPHQATLPSWEGLSHLEDAWVSPSHRLNNLRDSWRAFNYHLLSEVQTPQWKLMFIQICAALPNIPTLTFSNRAKMHREASVLQAASHPRSLIMSPGSPASLHLSHPTRMKLNLRVLPSGVSHAWNLTHQAPQKSTTVLPFCWANTAVSLGTARQLQPEELPTGNKKWGNSGR